ncbi:hypothetical protein MPTK1_1g21750 [Marchantia polymorpha subsp. ruderalis]|uniref:VTT domain-containing protein n=2 Tax=Marchantia polymorpha TaxID=3197 RepID=A0AAF6AST6_MARPO|nr:hypothetical protein MARPO_0001s0510 [Marchantia polymorpha]BBM99506.1 hypothetical protein Mp_1g21750 [Marchantia polymorpha subsp. ruderalis]|eukprot:PTQ50588.1 hypothetical protein MARPO_0001s0510 [Marchantia polymorpha]
MATFQTSVGDPGRQAEECQQKRTERETVDVVNKINFPLTQGELGAVVIVFSVFAMALSIIYLTMPTVDYQVLKLPHNVDEVRLLTEYVSGYAKDYTLQVVLGYFVTYMFMQTFMIPGTIFMSLLAGSLFGVTKGLILVIVTATSGASSCFFLSKLVGRPIAHWLWPEKLSFFSSEVARRKKSLLNYMLFLRITPTLPNTFINVASPIVDVPYRTFFLATLFGLIPAAFVTVRAGLALNDLHSITDLYDAKTLGTLFLIGVVSILPTWAEKVRARPSREHAA